jgi:hypothetical protein
LEYVVRPDQTLWVTPGKAGHLLLAEAGEVLAAGQLVLVKDVEGKVAMAVVTNASGTYKPSLFSVMNSFKDFGFVRELGPGQLVLSEGEPLTTQTVKVLMKARNIANGEVDQVIKNLNTFKAAVNEKPEAKLRLFIDLDQSCKTLSQRLPPLVAPSSGTASGT